MKKTVNEIIDIYEVLQNLSQRSATFKVSYWITKNLKQLDDTYMFFIQKRSSVYEEYLYQDADGNYFKVESDNLVKFNLKDESDEYAQEFSDTFNELLTMECEFTPYLIPLDALMESNIAMTPQEVEIIECLVEED